MTGSPVKIFILYRVLIIVWWVIVYKKMLMATILIILLFVASSGCTDLYHILQTYVPTPTPGPSTHIEIGKNAPTSTVKDVTIIGQGNTITIRGRGSYNMNTHQDYFTLNEGNADITIHLKEGGFGCFIALDYTATGATEIIPLLSFTIEKRVYDQSSQVYVPYAGQYYLAVNWGGEWEVKITQ